MFQSEWLIEKIFGVCKKVKLESLDIQKTFRKSVFSWDVVLVEYCCPKFTSIQNLRMWSYLLTGSCRCNSIKLGPKSNDWCPCKRRHIRKKANRDTDLPNAKKHQRLLATIRIKEARKDSSLEWRSLWREEHCRVDTLISDFKSPEMWENKF